MEIIYYDDTLIVVNKPAGLLSIRDGYNPDLPTVKCLVEKDFGPVWVVHRLDKDTSGTMVFTRNSESHRIMNMAFEKRKVKKQYHALCIGFPETEKFLISLPLRVNGDRFHRTIIDHASGKPAETAIEVIKKNNEMCLVKAFPYSGYTHQIRAHLAFSGFPIIADLLYAKKSNLNFNYARIIQRPALHAFQIEFDHPLSQAPSIFSANYPEDFFHAINLT